MTMDSHQVGKGVDAADGCSRAKESRGGRVSLHRMQANHIAFGIANERNKTIFANGEFFLDDLTPVFLDPASFDGAVDTGEIHQSAVAARCNTLHFHKENRGLSPITLRSGFYPAWIPAFAGMTMAFGLSKWHSGQTTVF